MTTTAEHLKSVVPNISVIDVEEVSDKVKDHRKQIFAIALPVIALALLVIVGVIERKELMKMINKYK
mgnify:CR=1 FL=1